MAEEREPTVEDVEALVGAATPHFAFQIRARVQGADQRPPRRSSGPPLRGGTDRASRAPRPLDVEGRRGAARVAGADRLGDDLPSHRPVGPLAGMTFAGKSVLVTGGSRGIGREIALRFAALGAARVAIGYFRSDAAAEETGQDIEAVGAEPLLLRGNVGDPERVASFLEQAGPTRRPRRERGDRRDPARCSSSRRSTGTGPERERALRLHACASRAPSMPAGSSIVAVSSLGSVRVLDNYVLVGISKAAIEALVRYLAVELAPREIRVNAVSAGLVETDALDAFPNREEMIAFYREPHARGQARRAQGGRRRRLLSRLASGRDDPRPHARRRRRLLAARIGPWWMPSTNSNRAVSPTHAGRGWTPTPHCRTPTGLPRLGAEDLDLLATAAYMLGRDDDCADCLERAHHAHLEDGRAAARRALRVLAGT